MGDTEPKTDLRRIARLFRPYRRRLVAVLALILLSAGLGMVSPFLLRQVLDAAIPQRDTGLLTALVLGMIGVSIATGMLGVGQTWLSNVVGQRVMHDLRSTVYRRLPPGPHGRHLVAGRGVPVGVRHPPGQDHGARARAREPLRARVRGPRRPRGALADGRALADGLRADELRDHARGGVLVRWSE